MLINIAICDDDMEFIGILRNYIERSSADYGFNILAYSDGASLIAKFQESSRPFDIVFLDVEMPKLDGHQTAAKLREFDRSVSLFFVSHHKEPAHFQAGYRAKAIQYLTKPLLFEDFCTEFLLVLPSIEKDRDRFLSTGSRVSLGKIHFDDIVQVISTKHGANIHAIGAEIYRSTLRIHEIARLLENEDFMLVNAGQMINLRYVYQFAADEKKIVLNNGDVLYPSKKMVRQVGLRYNAYLNRKYINR